jgi:hypothetical protein
VIGRNFEIDRELRKRSMRAQTLKPVHAWIKLQPGNPRAHQRGGDAQRMGIKFRHADDHNLPKARWRVLKLTRCTIEDVRISGFVPTKESDDRRDMDHDRCIDAEQIGDRTVAAVVLFHQARRKLATLRD